MECTRAMSSVCSGSASLAIGGSGIGRGAGENASFNARVRGLASLRVQGARVRGVSLQLQGEGSKGFRWRRSIVRASSSGTDEPLESKAENSANEAGREFDAAKQSLGSSAEDVKGRAGREADEAKESLGSSAEDLKSKASRGLDESKQSFSSTVEGLKRKAGETRSHAEETANKELEKLKDITNQLLEQAELARQKLAATAQETAYKQKDNLAYVVENGPEPVKEVAESALDAHYSESGKGGSKIHDFCLGIPYGGFLVGGGLLWFIISGATSAIRFGVLLGSAVLYLSVTSLKKWKKGESSLSYIQGQAAITAFIFLRYYRRYSANKVFFPTGVVGLASGAMLAFYIYVLVSGGNPPKKPKSQSN